MASVHSLRSTFLSMLAISLSLAGCEIAPGTPPDGLISSGALPPSSEGAFSWMPPLPPGCLEALRQGRPRQSSGPRLDATGGYTADSNAC